MVIFVFLGVFLIIINSGWLFLFWLNCFMLLDCFFGLLEVEMLLVMYVELFWLKWFLIEFLSDKFVLCLSGFVFLGFINWFILKLNLLIGRIILLELVDFFLYDWVLIIIWRILLWFFLVVCLIIYDIVVM